jgi:hypothetical protein
LRRAHTEHDQGKEAGSLDSGHGFYLR